MEFFPFFSLQFNGYVAVQAKLSAFAAAILMPLSSISIVVFVTIATKMLAR
jgi:hypothetical protein|tara:strand:- start:1198 stop:1350 length:153 start_codon:yes stop_codon:yes gene_type:complete